MIISDMNKRLDISRFQNLTAEEHDSCGIVAIVEKSGVPSRKNMLDTIEALIKMEHRSGFIGGEGDGCGILTDLPRKVWQERLTKQGFPPNIVHDPRFAVAHIFIPKNDSEQSADYIQTKVRKILSTNELQILSEVVDQVNNKSLGKNGQKDEPHFWQIACLANHEKELARLLFDLSLQIEQQHPVHVASFSTHSAVYKLMGAANLLPQYYQDLNHPGFESIATIGHNRYSTNTLSNFYRVQPFSLLGHNGEINTIRKLRDEAEMIGVTLAVDSSDSQDVNRLIETLIHHYGYSLLEAIEVVFPPILHEVKNLPTHLQNLYMYYRQAWGPFAQGPAGIISRYGDECAFRVDALGLRPLWFIESDRSLIFSSEQGILPTHEMISEPKSLAPGETIGVKLYPQAEVLHHHQLQQTVYERSANHTDLADFQKHLTPQKGKQNASQNISPASKQDYAAFGWDREQVQMVKDMATKGADPIRSLGHDAPLAALAQTRQNIADYIKESVAVVTNPAIDREREIEHFSTRIVIGKRPSLTGLFTTEKRIELLSPILVEGELANEVTAQFATQSFEALLQAYENQVAKLTLTYPKGTRLADRLDELAAEAISAAEQGNVLLLLDDQVAHQEDQLYLDPHLAISKIDQALKTQTASDGQNLRRNVSIIIRSGALRNLHDLAITVGLGAEAISPYLMFQTITNQEKLSASKLYDALNKGLEKIISTIGIHELRGYARLFSAIGLHPELADILEIVNYCGTEQAGLDFTALEQDAEVRYQDYTDAKAKEARLFHLWPRVWKPIGQIATGDISYEEFASKMENLESKNPTSLRHVVDLKTDANAVINVEEVDISVGEHDLPMLISSMSFGSQGEVAFRAYAEAADRLNMVSMNGEGGEIKDMLGKYPRTRGHQIASGRFGVNVELANSANILEIKIGQGAKPGEGGHLPGKKVTDKVAAARNATTGSDLISPSNNHDIYSIEDLAQMITELKTANKRAKVIVKVPIVPNIGTIAVGIAKAGANVISLSGFDGGTGAARIHALQHVGLPIEVGVKAAHQALIEAGIRDQVEIWADGGLKSSLDVVKLMLLGANRIGFATLAMIAIGCTSCRGCHLDTCHVGIATQIKTTAEAKDHGLRRFIPREQDVAIDALMRLFTTYSKEIKRLTAQLGFKRTQDLVGRSDLLVQTRELDKVDLTDLLAISNKLQAQTTPIAHVPAEKSIVAVGAEQLHIDQEINFEQPIVKSFSEINSTHRVMISDISGARVRDRLDGSYHGLPTVSYQLTNGSVPGNGFAAYHADGINISVHGGAQDGALKTAFGGRVSILKSPNQSGAYINGSVGKSFCYGAQKGLFIVQGNADSRAGIRLSGADIIIGGEVTAPLQDKLGMIASRANIKGFAFEYMTNGRAIVLGDPGPWICSGMTGGVVYLRLQPDMGLDETALKKRMAKSAKVSMNELSEQGKQNITDLLTTYREELLHAEQFPAAKKIEQLLIDPATHFVQVIPIKQQADPSISTE